MRSRVLSYIRERGLMRAGDRVCVAVSGGADSVALLRVLLELRTELGLVLAVAHFNHGLRGEDSETDEAFVADLARHQGLEFFAGHADVRECALTAKLGVEAAGRKLRYTFLTRLAEEQRFNSVATAHTLDDQAETVLLKFLRGAGTRGLAGIYPILEGGHREDSRARHSNVAANSNSVAKKFVMRCGLPTDDEQQDPSRAAAAGGEPGAQAPGMVADRGEPRSGDKPRIVRPLLGVTRDEVEAYLTSLGQSWREDESNLDHRFARNRVRHSLLPLLEREYNPNIRRVLTDASDLARAEEEYWRALVERELEARQSAKSTAIPQGLKPDAPAAGFGTAEAVPLQSPIPARLSLNRFARLTLAIQRRLLRRFAETEDLALDFEHVDNLVRCATGELSKTELPGGWLAVRRGECLELRPPASKPASVGYEYTLPIPGEVHIAEIGLTMRAVIAEETLAQESDETDTLLSVAGLGPELTVRNWRPGDRFWPAHTGAEEKLKRLFAEKHIPAEQRATWPVVLMGDEIVWVRGFPVGRAYAWGGRGDGVKIVSD